MDLNEFYSYDEINKTKANYRLIIGERSNGKTFGFKKIALKNAIENNKQFAYLRRTVEEIKMKRVSNYFADMDDILQDYCLKFFPQYDFLSIIASVGEFKLYGVSQEPYKSEFIKTIGYYFALNQSSYDKSNSYPEVNLICYEEFLTRERELPDEFTLFTNFISTIKRKRDDMIVYMLGNTVNRNSSILKAMNIDVRNLKQGEISLFQYFGEKGVNTVAVEYCRSYSQTAESEQFFYFERPQELALMRGEWEVKDYKKFIFDEISLFTPNLSLILQKDNIYIFCYLIDNHLYVSDNRLYKARATYITITDRNNNFKNKIYNFNCNIKKIENLKKIILWLHNNNQVSYISNVVGDDFEFILNELV